MIAYNAHSPLALVGCCHFHTTCFIITQPKLLLDTQQRTSTCVSASSNNRQVTPPRSTYILIIFIVLSLHLQVRVLARRAELVASDKEEGQRGKLRGQWTEPGLHGGTKQSKGENSGDDTTAEGIIDTPACRRG